MKSIEAQAMDLLKLKFFQLSKSAKQLTNFEIVPVFISYEGKEGFIFTDAEQNYYLYPYEALKDDIHSFFGDSHRERTSDKKLCEDTIGRLVGYYKKLAYLCNLYLSIQITHPFSRLESKPQQISWQDEKETSNA